MSAPFYREVTIIQHPLVHAKLSELRAATTPVDLFRRRLRELATLMTFEVTRTLPTVPVTVQTPLAAMEGCQLEREVVFAPILRAGLGLLEGMLRVMPEAGVAHVGLFRNEETHLPQSYYFKGPKNLATAEVIVADPMLATGGSAIAAIQQLKAAGAQSIRYVCLVACPPGLANLQKAHPEVPIFTAAVDPELNSRAYIVPGLGDAGDRFFGTTE